MATPPRTPTVYGSATSRGQSRSPDPTATVDALAWCPEETDISTSGNHSATQLPDKLSVIVDSGAWTNLVGEKRARQMAKRAVEAGLRPQ